MIYAEESSCAVAPRATDAVKYKASATHRSIDTVASITSSRKCVRLSCHLATASLLTLASLATSLVSSLSAVSWYSS
ncbi:hypothetical protein CC79DRAFT_1329412 [Sarocladium strictum]